MCAAAIGSLDLTSWNRKYGVVRNYGQAIKPHAHSLVTISTNEAPPPKGPTTFQSTIINWEANVPTLEPVGEQLPLEPQQVFFSSESRSHSIFLLAQNWRIPTTPLQCYLLMAILPQALHITFRPCAKICWCSSFPDRNSSPYLVTYRNWEGFGLSSETPGYVVP